MTLPPVRRQPFTVTVAALAALLPGCGPGEPTATEPARTTESRGTGATAPSSAGPWFREDAPARGLTFRHESGQGATFLFPEIVTGGAALLDIDGDGRLDVYCVQAGRLVDPPAQRPSNRLFRNTDAGFVDVTDGSGVDDRGYGMGAAVGDFDNDGRPDLYVTNVGANVLYRNEGDGRFTDVTTTAGVGHPGWGTSATFLDYDGDGDLDLFVVNYIHWSIESERDCVASTGERDYCEPASYNAPAADVLYRNEGDGTFRDVTTSSGIDRAYGNGLGVVTGDLDDDGDVDIYVANDGTDNQLWINQGDGTFRDDAMLAGCAVDLDGIAKAGMGVCAEDIDDDRDLDLLVVNLTGETDSLYRNEGGWFVDATARVGLAGLTRTFTRFGLGLVDFDNDGYLDLFTANGRVRREEASDDADPFVEPNLLARGGADGRFTERMPRGGTDPVLVATSRAAAFGDLDNDGGMDVVVVNRDGPVHLLHNVVPARGHWLILRVLDDHGRDALNARVTVRLGSRTVTREVRSGWSYLAANDPRVHVGLGSSTRADDVTIRWPDGRTEQFGPLECDRVVTLRCGEGRSR